MNTVNTTRLTPETLDRLKKAIRLRKSKGILIKHISKEMGYTNLSSAGDIEAMRYKYESERVEQYIRAVHKLARNPEHINTGSPAVRFSPPASADLMAEFRKSVHTRKTSGVTIPSVSHEMTALLSPLGYRLVSDRMVYHFENKRHLDTNRAMAYIAAVEKLCASPQIAITMPAPDEAPSPVEQPAPPTAIDYSRTPLVELVSIAGRCNEELQRRRAVFAAMIGRDDEAAWNAAIAAASTPTPRHP